MSKKSTSPEQHTQLRAALQKQITTMSQGQIAKNAGVSNRTVSQIWRGAYAISPLPTDPNITARQFKGYVAAITRLASCVEIDPVEALQEYHIDSTSPHVQDMIMSALAKSEKRANRITVGSGTSDVLSVIRAIAQSDYTGKVTLADIEKLLIVEQAMGAPLTPDAAKALLVSKEVDQATQ